MQIYSIHLINFRGFKDETFVFKRRFTAAIGDNGKGKSSLLHGLRIGTGAFFLGIKEQGIYRRHIHDDEIRSSYDYKVKQSSRHVPVVVECEGKVGEGERFVWRRVLSSLGSSTSSNKKDVGEIRDTASTLQKNLTDGSHPSMPVIAYFDVKQLGSKVRRHRRTKVKRVIIRDGYYNCLGNRSDESAYYQWFYNYDRNLKGGLEFQGTYEAVIQAVGIAVPYLENIYFNHSVYQIEADCVIPGQEQKRIEHSIMSDGLQRILGIVLDIAYRCVILNGHLGINAIKESNGIVMIDELDMHLHPNWQKHIVQDLKSAFPKIQFVVTTHSPFIVQSLDNEELINLDEVNGVLPKELPLNKVVTDIMKVNSIQSDDFENRYDLAKEAFTELALTNNSQLTLDNYEKVKKEIESIVYSETTDPIYKAYLEKLKDLNETNS